MDVAFLSDDYSRGPPLTHSCSLFSLILEYRDAEVHGVHFENCDHLSEPSDSLTVRVINYAAGHYNKVGEAIEHQICSNIDYNSLQ